MEEFYFSSLYPAEPTSEHQGEDVHGLGDRPHAFLMVTRPPLGVDSTPRWPQTRRSAAENENAMIPAWNQARG